MREHLAGINPDAQPAAIKPSKFMAQWPSSFESAQDHLELSQKTIPPELLNNLGVLLQKDNRNAEALKLYEEAIENCDQLLKEGNADDKRLLALRITLRFNFACSYDTASRIGEASEIFKQITREEPSYTDAYMRLAYLAQRRGDFKRAIEYID